MTRIARKLAVKAANKDTLVGVAAGIALSVYRLLSLVAFARSSRTPISLLGAALLIEVLLIVGCTIGIHRRSDGAAASLAGLFVLRLGFVWYVSGRIWPPISLVTLLIAYGLYRGIRGTSELAAMPITAIPKPLANEAVE